MAQNALLTLEAVNAATARAWIKGGHKIFSEVYQRFLVMAGLKKQKAMAGPAKAKANRKNLVAQLTLLGAKAK